MCSACAPRPTGPVINPIRDGQSHRGPAEILDVLHDTDVHAFLGHFRLKGEKRMVRSLASA